MSRDLPTTTAEMIAWLRAHPREPFYTSHSGGRLLVGTRNDDGEIAAWACKVTDHLWELDRLSGPGSWARQPGQKEEGVSYLGEPGFASTWEVGCNGCNRKVKGAEPPPTWARCVDAVPVEHLCPTCRKRKALAARPGGIDKGGGR